MKENTQDNLIWLKMCVSEHMYYKVFTSLAEEQQTYFPDRD